MKKFKKGQTVYLRLSNGQKVEGKYKKQTNDGKHIVVAKEFGGLDDRLDEIWYNRNYVVPDSVISDSMSTPSVKQYKSWLQQAANMTKRIDEYNNDITVFGDTEKEVERIKRKTERNKRKLELLNKKIEEYEAAK